MHLTWHRFLTLAQASRADVENHVRRRIHDVTEAPASRSRTDEVKGIGPLNTALAVCSDIKRAHFDKVNPQLAQQWVNTVAALHADRIYVESPSFWRRAVLVDPSGRPLTDAPPAIPRKPPMMSVPGLRWEVPVAVILGVVLAGVISPGIGQLLLLVGVVVTNGFWLQGILASGAALGYLQGTRQRKRCNAFELDTPDVTTMRALASSTADEMKDNITGDITISAPNNETPRASSTEVWDNACERLAAVASDYAAFETDPTQFFYRPLLADTSHPAVQAFTDAFADANALRTLSCPSDSAMIVMFADRVTAAQQTWRAANEAAVRAEDDPFTTEQHALLRKAERALTLALDDTAPIHERSAAYTRVIDLFRRASVRPPQCITTTLRHELEHQTRLALPPSTTV